MNKTNKAYLRAFVFPVAICFSFLSFIDVSAQNYALSMNGTSTSYADLGTINPTNNFSTGFTVECWIKWGAFNSWSRMLDIGNGTASDNILFANQGTSNNLRFEVYYGSTVSGISGPTNLVTGQWYHVAATVDGSGNAKIYADGVQVASGTINVPKNISRTTCYTGKSNWAADSYMDGTIDELRIWNVVRTQTQIKQYMFKSVDPTTTGLVAYYHCNENGGTTLVNSCSGNGAGNGTTQAALTWTASPIQFAGNAINFDGSDDYVNVPYNSSLDITSAITLEAWVYATKNTGIQDVISKSSASVNTGYIFPRTDDGWAHVVIYLHINGGWRTLSAVYPSLNAWHHLAATYDGTTIKIYIDGTLAASQAQTGSIATNTNVLLLGNQSGFSSEYFGGYGDEFRIWNVARTQAQIQANMNAELDPTTQTGLVSYYTADQGIAGGTNTGLITLVDQSGTNNGTLTNFALTGSSSNYATQNSNLTPLPLQWLSFTAQAQGSDVLLQWSTATEQNTKDFIIQRSSDGSSWSTIGQVAAAGNSSTVSNYSYVDGKPNTGINYYRILQEDRDDHFSYSKVVAVRFDALKVTFTILNNPVTNGMLQLQVNTPSVLNIYNSSGSLLLRQHLNTGPVSIDLSSYPKGMYWLKAGENVQKILIQ